MGCLWSSDRRSRTAEVGESPSFAHLIVKSGTSGFSSVQGRKKGENYFASEETIPSSPDRKAASKVSKTCMFLLPARIIDEHEFFGLRVRLNPIFAWKLTKKDFFHRLDSASLLIRKRIWFYSDRSKKRVLYGEELELLV